jgi:hypothetical protein
VEEAGANPPFPLPEPLGFSCLQLLLLRLEITVVCTPCGMASPQLLSNFRARASHWRKSLCTRAVLHCDPLLLYDFCSILVPTVGLDNRTVALQSMHLQSFLGRQSMLNTHSSQSHSFGIVFCVAYALHACGVSLGLIASHEVTSLPGWDDDLPSRYAQHSVVHIRAAYMVR